jgi:nicotinamide mononucleotide transporter
MPHALLQFLQAHWLEVLGCITGVSCVLLGIAEIPWSWPVGITYNVLLFVVLWKHGVYALALLQIVYIGISLYGWWNWLRGGVGHGTLRISRTPPSLSVTLAVIAAIGIFLVHAILGRYTDSTIPWLDAVTTTLSLVAQYLLSRKLMSTWLVFILVDIIAIIINLEKHLFPIVALYGFFIVLCILGYRKWSKSLHIHSRIA